MSHVRIGTPAAADGTDSPDREGAVVIGDALIDEIRGADSPREYVGGAGLNVAVGLARLGVATTLIAMVGDDEPGDRIRAHLSEAGVRLIATDAPEGTSRAVSVRSASGEPTYEFNLAARRRRIRFTDAATDALRGAAVVAVSSFPFDDEDQARELASVLDASGAAIAIDPNPRAGMLSDRAAFVRQVEAIAARRFLVKVGDEDAALLSGESLDALAARLVRLGVQVVLATRGADGAGIHAAPFAVNQAVPELPGRIVDTMGAGDAIFAATIAQLLRARPQTEPEWDELLSRSMAVAAATCRHEGALLRLPD